MANSLDAWVPELWARESIAILEESMIFGALVHRDFNSEVAQFGDIVNTRQPAEFEAVMYEKGDTISNQDATATNVPVPLDQIADVSFLIYDVESAYSFADLAQTYLKPAVSAIARIVDRKIAGQAVQFLANTTGGMGSLTYSNANQYLVETATKMNTQKAHEDGRNLVVSPVVEGQLLQTELFVSTEKAGTTAALRRASLGRLYDFDVMRSLNIGAIASVPSANTDTADTTAAAEVAGAATVSMTTASTITAGQYFTVAGDMTPLRAASVAGTTPQVVTTTRPLREAVASGAVVQGYTQGAVDNGDGYAANHTKVIHVDGGPIPQVGMIVSFDVNADEYMIVAVTNTAGSDYDITLDRALVTAITDGEAVNYGPVGDLNLAFHRNAITLVNRPLDNPGAGAGARVGVVNSRNVSMRVSLAWVQSTKAMQVSVDTLFGVKTLDTDLGVVMLG